MTKVAILAFAATTSIAVNNTVSVCPLRAEQVTTGQRMSVLARRPVFLVGEVASPDDERLFGGKSASNAEQWIQSHHPCCGTVTEREGLEYGFTAKPVLRSLDSCLHESSGTINNVSVGHAYLHDRRLRCCRSEKTFSFDDTGEPSYVEHVHRRIVTQTS